MSGSVSVRRIAEVAVSVKITCDVEGNTLFGKGFLFVATVYRNKRLISIGEQNMKKKEQGGLGTEGVGEVRVRGINRLASP